LETNFFKKEKIKFHFWIYSAISCKSNSKIVQIELSVSVVIFSFAFNLRIVLLSISCFSLKAYAILVTEISSTVDILQRIKFNSLEIYQMIKKSKDTLSIVEDMFIDISE